MPLLWRIPEDYPQSQIGRYNRVHGPDRFLFLEGCRIQEPFKIRPQVKFDCKKDDLHHDDCIWSDAGVPIVNERMKSFLSERVFDQVQFFDVDISAKNGGITGHYILNVTSIVEVIDMNSSKYDFVFGTEGIMSFSALRVIDGSMGGVSIGRDKNYLSYLFLSDLLAQQFKIAGFQGLSLVEPSSIV
jgi:hypothetical protein